MKVLIADDDRELCQLLGAVLRPQGHEVVFAFDAAQALIIAKNTSPDIIALDINMPGGTGMGALQKLKMNMMTSMIPILVITGSTNEQDCTTVHQMGADGFMQKPLDVEKFCETLLKLSGLPAPASAAQG
jgi:DNA-binding response OmpR family regulator